MDRIAKKLEQYRNREIKLQQITMALKISLFVTGIAFFIMAIVIGGNDSPAGITALVMVSLFGGIITNQGFNGETRVWPVAGYCCACFILLATASYSESLFMVDGLTILAAGVPICVALVCALVKREKRKSVVPDSISVAIHEAGHILVLPALGGLCEYAKISTDFKNSVFGYVEHRFQGSPREIYCATMLTALGGICAEEAFIKRGTTGYSVDLFTWETAARDWLNTFGAMATPVILHLMLCEQEQLIMSHLRRNSGVLIDVAKRFQEMGEVSKSEVAFYLADAKVNPDIEEWFRENSQESKTDPPLPETVSFTYYNN